MIFCVSMGFYPVPSRAFQAPHRVSARQPRQGGPCNRISYSCLCIIIAYSLLMLFPYYRLYLINLIIATKTNKHLSKSLQGGVGRIRDKTYIFL